MFGIPKGALTADSAAHALEIARWEHSEICGVETFASRYEVVVDDSGEGTVDVDRSRGGRVLLRGEDEDVDQDVVRGRGRGTTTSERNSAAIGAERFFFSPPTSPGTSAGAPKNGKKSSSSTTTAQQEPPPPTNTTSDPMVSGRSPPRGFPRVVAKSRAPLNAPSRLPRVKIDLSSTTLGHPSEPVDRWTHSSIVKAFRDGAALRHPSKGAAVVALRVAHAFCERQEHADLVADWVLETLGRRPHDESDNKNSSTQKGKGRPHVDDNKNNSASRGYEQTKVDDHRGPHVNLRGTGPGGEGMVSSSPSPSSQKKLKKRSPG